MDERHREPLRVFNDQIDLAWIVIFKQVSM